MMGRRASRFDPKAGRPVNNPHKTTPREELFNELQLFHPPGVPFLSVPRSGRVNYRHTSLLLPSMPEHGRYRSSLGCRITLQDIYFSALQQRMYSGEIVEVLAPLFLPSAQMADGRALRTVHLSPLMPPAGHEEYRDAALIRGRHDLRCGGRCFSRAYHPLQFFLRLLASSSKERLNERPCFLMQRFRAQGI